MFPLPPQVVFGWKVVKTFCSTAKFGMYVAFALLFLFLLNAHRCKKEEPAVTYTETPSQIEQIVIPAIEHHDQAVVNDRMKQIETAEVQKTEEKKVVKKVKKIQEDTTLSDAEKHTQIGEAQMDQLESLYAQYYGGAPPDAAAPANGTS